MPMPPASRPALSWSVPSVGETVSASCCWNVSGSAPYLSTLARSVADVWLNWPVISVSPLIVPWISGAEITRWSRMNATRLAGSCGLTVTLCLAVYSAQIAWPWPLKDSDTRHCGLLWSGGTTLAPPIWVPSMIALSSRYFSVPSWLQAAITWSGRSVAPVVCLPQSSRASSCASCGVVPGYWEASPEAEGVADGAGVAAADGLPVAEPLGAGAAAGRPAQPAGDGLALAFGLADGVADGESDPPADPPADPDGVGVALPPVAGATGNGPAFTGRNRSCAVWPSCLAWSPFWPGTEITIRLVPCVTTSASATPMPSTRRWMICRAWSRASGLGGRPSSVRACSVTVVPPCRSRPSFGVAESPVKKTSAYRTASRPSRAPR